MTHLSDEQINKLYSEIEKLKFESTIDNYLLMTHRMRIRSLMDSDRLTLDQKQIIRELLYLDDDNFVSVDCPF